MRNQNRWNWIFTLLFWVCTFANCTSQLGGGTETGNPTITTFPSHDDTSSTDGEQTSAGPSSGSDDDDSDSVTYERGSSLAQGTNGDPSIAAQSIVIESEAEFESFWNQLFASETSIPTLPSVNFATKMVLAVVYGAQNTDGYGVEIASTYEDEGEITVSVDVTEPGNSCLATDEPINAYHLVSLNKSDALVTFSTSTEAEDCE